MKAFAVEKVVLVGRKGKGSIAEFEAWISGVFWRGRFVIGLIGDLGGDFASVAPRLRFEGAIIGSRKRSGSGGDKTKII